MNYEQDQHLLPYARVILRLLQGVIYVDEEKYWEEIRNNQIPLQKFFGQIGLNLIFNAPDGYAYVDQPEAKDGEEKTLPRLMRTRQLKYEQSLLCILLREAIEERDKDVQLSLKIYITKAEIRELIDVFFKDQTNRSRLFKELDSSIEYAVKQLGILRLNREDTLQPENTQYEIRKIIKAMITAEKLEEVRFKLEKHLNTIGNE